MKRFASVLLVGVLLGGAAYGARAWAADAAEPALAGPHEGFGPHAWIMSALDSITVRPDQRAAIEQLRTDMKAKMEPMREAHRQIIEAVAAEVESGTIDHTRIDPLVAAAKTSAATHAADFEAAATSLHSILDASQRQALVDAMAAKMHKGGHEFMHRGEHGARLAKLAQDIGLSQSQIDTIREKFQALRASERATHEADREAHHAEMEAHHARMKAIAAAFVSDSFDAHALQIGQNLGRGGAEFGSKMLSHVETALPVLTAAQRTLLAQKLRAGHVEHALEE